MGFKRDSRKILHFLSEGEFGLEKESLRTDRNGHLAHTPHPFMEEKKIDRDFCENQVELITGVSCSTHDLWNEIAALHYKTAQTLQQLPSGREYIWPFSNPPYVNDEADIPIAAFTGGQKSKELYREYLAQKYGKRKMLFSGIHFNYSVPEALLLEEYKENYPADDRIKLSKEFLNYKNQVYLNLAEKVLKYSWLIVYLTAASPVMDASYFPDGVQGQTAEVRYSSPRCSEIGYWNEFVPVLDFHTLDSYVESIQSYIDQGQIRVASELYYPVRLKPRGENSLEHLRENGINHIELRMLDLNPLSPVGIDERDLEFLHYFLVYLLFQEEEEMGAQEQLAAIRNMKNAARYEDAKINIEDGWNEPKNIRLAAEEVLDDVLSVLTEKTTDDCSEEIHDIMSASEEGTCLHVSDERRMSIMCNAHDKVRKCLDYQKKKLHAPMLRYAAKIRDTFEKDYVKKGLALASYYAQFYDNSHLKELFELQMRKEEEEANV